MAFRPSLDAADTAARSISMVVVMHRAPWLQLSGFSREVQSTVEDLPFDGHRLFSETMNDSLDTLKDSRATICSLRYLWTYKQEVFQ